MNPLFSSLMQSDQNSASEAPENAHTSAENQTITLQVAQLEPMPPAAEQHNSEQNFVPFEQAAFWQQQLAHYQQAGPKLWQQGLIGHDISHLPTMVNSYCQILVKYLLDGLYNGAIDDSQPIYVLELGAGCGRFAILVLQRLDTLLTEYGLDDIKLCYLLSDCSEKNRQFIQTHPYLQPYFKSAKARVIDADSAFFNANKASSKASSDIAADIIDYRAFEAAFVVNNESANNESANDKPVNDEVISAELKTDAAKAQSDKARPDGAQTKNPLIVMANHFFSRLPQALFYLHYGQLYRCELLAADPDKPDDSGGESTQENSILYNKKQDSVCWQYRWGKIDDINTWLVGQVQTLQPLLIKQLQHQLTNDLAQLPHQPLLLPIAALAALDKLQQQHPQGLMLLTADFGPTTIDELKQVQLFSPNKVSPKKAPSALVAGLTPLATEHELLVPPDITQLALPATMGMSMDSLAGSETHAWSLNWPVNFLSLTDWAAHNAGLSRSIKQRRQGTAFNITMIDSAQRDFVMTKLAVEQYLVNTNPDDSQIVIKSLRGAVNVLSEQEILSHLRSSDDDPKLLKVFLPRLLKQGVLINSRISWCQTLSQVWQHYIPIGEFNLLDHEQGGHEQTEREQADEFAFKLGLLAIDLSHWSLAKACFISCIHWYGESTAVFHNLALVCQATNELELALNFAELALALSPDDTQAAALQGNIADYQNHCAELSWFNSEKASEDLSISSTLSSRISARIGLRISSKISLTPLAPQHVSEFYLQYRDPQIAPLTRSFELSSPAQVQAAISHWQQDHQRASYAVIHAELGFVGCTSLEFRDANLDTAPIVQAEQTEQDNQQVQKSNTSAYFSFWIGADYQNSGFGQQAALLCIEQAKAIAEQGKLEQLITSVWSFNRCSIHVLEKVGFKPLAQSEAQNAEPEKGEQQEVFYCLPLFTSE
ncbi:GNAT family N-acetyltransferase [Shewanella surugensis]|uniref:GNAT family N-acetyltransferase n=1 Tax=Shewanella surugensis TaxID=212020 RepID=A0ABT0L754_9GAMM|nr:GNAT family N-acetyltransferase [Shewanella surugensis]MCL1123192.1 GNAT family N-acetyltransferase [Shewanella surugensis]